MRQIEITVDEQFLELVPRPSKEEYTLLKNSIILEGQKDPIVVNKKGVVLDGHTRYEICRDLGIIPTSRIMHFETRQEEELYAIQCNTNRRHLNAFQKIEIYYKFYIQFKKESKVNINSKTENVYPIGGSLQRYSELIGVGEKRVHAGIKLIENADERTLTFLRSGSLAINTALRGLDVKKGKQGRTPKKKNPTLPILMRWLDNEKRDQLKEWL